MRVVFAAEALQRLFDVEDRIASDNPVAAAKIVDRILRRADQIALFPRSGRKVPEVDNDRVRELIEGNYRIVYHLVDDDTAEVVTIWDAREPLAPLDEDPD